MAKTLSKHSGRLSPVVHVDMGWFNPARAELVKVFEIAVNEHGPQIENKAVFAINWAENWLLSYAAGWSDFHDTLAGVKRVSALLPPPTSRLLLGVVTHKALLASPKRLGEHKAKTNPLLIRLLGPMVQAELFDEAGNQRCSQSEAVERAIATIERHRLLDPIPRTSMVLEWFKEWRAREEADGEAIPRPAVGRPKKNVG